MATKRGVLGPRLLHRRLAMGPRAGDVSSCRVHSRATAVSNKGDMDSECQRCASDCTALLTVCARAHTHFSAIKKLLRFSDRLYVKKNDSQKMKFCVDSIFLFVHLFLVLPPHLENNVLFPASWMQEYLWILVFFMWVLAS